MKLLIFLLLLVCSFGISLSSAKDGEILHQSKCIECHGRMTGGEGTVIYKRDDRIAGNKNELRRRVSSCSEGGNTGWGSAKKSAVVDYLNEKFYKY